MAYYAIIEHMDQPERAKFDRSLEGPRGRPARSTGTTDLRRMMRAPTR